MTTVGNSQIMRTIPLFITICLFSFPAQAQYGGGTGEPNDPYLIYTAEQMNQIGLHEEDWDKHFMLMADIDLSTYKGASFNLIGSYDSDWNEKSFTGVFQGNGHVISGFSCDGDAFLFFVGLFRSVDGVNARIQNLRLIDPNVIGGGIYIGALVGRLHNGTISNCVIEAGQVVASEGEDIGGIVGMNIQGVLSNCRAEGCVVQGRSGVGGLIGTNEGTIQNCYSSGEISGNFMIGGQVGRNFGSILNTYSTCRVIGSGWMQDVIGGLTGLNRGTIQASCATGDVTGIDHVGGLVGQNGDNSNITDSYATGHVSGRKHIGGLVGTCIQNNSIDKCYATGSVSAEENGGGLVGQHEGTLSECYSTACVIVDANKAGGLVGDNRGTIRMSCAHGHVSGKNYIGGLVGYNLKYDSVVTDSYARGSVHGEDFVGGLIGLQRGGIASRCYSTAKVTGATANSQTGGLIGVNYSDIPVENSFWDIEASGVTRSAGGEGKTTSEMQATSTFLNAGWDFVDETTNGTENIWWIFRGQDYPRLWWHYGQAFAPHPQDGATDVIQQLLLSWAPGGSALQHDVYFGEDEQVVADATTESLGIYRGRQAPEIISYDPGSLELFKAYYWRIDEVNEADPNNLPKGKIWSFTTADFIVVDDFESYKDHDNEIWYSWHDGLGYGAPGVEPYYPGNGTGSAVGDETWMGGGHMETVIVHGGRQSMPYSYDNDKQGFAKYSEAEKTLIYPRDWTEEGIEVLSLWFYGDPVNAPEPMYVAVANTNGSTAVVVYHDNPDATLIRTWTEWTIDLQDFADQGVNLNDVNSIAIGFGDRNNPQPGGLGRTYFDDIRLLP